MADDTTQARAERRIWLALTGIVAVTFAVAALLSLRGEGGDRALPVISTLPDFALISSLERPVTRADLAGQVWVADFIFTSCAGVCPILSARMAEIQRELAERQLDARLVSFSVDPARDTPAVLREYAARWGADPDVWWFVTGERDALYELIGRGFLLSVAERDPGEPAADGHDLITHSDRLVLVDRKGRIRAYYHGTDRDSVPALLADLERLARS